MVWRDRGEPAIDVHDMQECLIHGVRGGLRTYPFLPVGPPASSSTRFHLSPPPCLDQGAGTIAFAIRSGVNLVLLLARIKNFPKYGSIPCSGESQLAET
jgi:hypothetical protein